MTLQAQSRIWRACIALLLIAAQLLRVAAEDGLAPNVAAGDPLQQAGLALLPTPQEARILGLAPFRIGASLAVSGNGPFAAIVRDVLTERTALRDLPDSPGGVTVSTPSQPDAAVWRHDQSYALSVGPTGIRIEAEADVGIFYAAQTLAQLIGNGAEIPALEIRDWPSIPKRLVMIATDQGGFQVIDLAYWKRAIRELAGVKINVLMPYFDAGTFAYRKHPYLGTKGDGGFTVEKARILSAYAAEHFVELVPQQNSLGHLGGALGHQELAHLRDGGGTINMVKPESLSFLGDLYDDLAEGFPNATAIHVGGDEFGGDFGRDPAVAARIAEIGGPAVYAEFLMKLRGLLRQRNRTMMIWWNEQGYTLDAAPQLAKDIAVFDWHYGPQEDYPSLDRLLDAGFSQTWATPAVTRYYDGTNDWGNTFANIGGFARAGARRRVPGICTCTWVHGMWGGRNLFELNLYGLVYSAESGWNPERNIDTLEFGRRFAAAWLGYRGSDAALRVSQGIHAAYGERAEQGFWRDNRGLEPLVGSPLLAVAERGVDSPGIGDEARRLLTFCDRADAALLALQAKALRNQVTLDTFRHDVRIHRLAANRIRVGLDLARWCRDIRPPAARIGKRILHADFAHAALGQEVLALESGGSIAGGIMTTGPIESWKREGLTVGPIALPDDGILIEYDVRPKRFGQQFQQFASRTPSAHHYMVFLATDQRFHVHTRFAGSWSEQDTMRATCQADRWYHCTVSIRRNGFSFKAVDRETGESVCRSGLLPLDDPGDALVFELADNHSETRRGEDASDWDNLTVSTLAPLPTLLAEPPPGMLADILALIDQHRQIEADFEVSILNAGGGSSDARDLSTGGINFRARAGRLDLERIVDDLEAGRLPAGYGE